MSPMVVWDGTSWVPVGSTGVVITPSDNPPSAPGAISFASVSETGFTASWGAATDDRGVSAYEVYLDGTLVATVAGTSYTFTDLIAGVAYTVSVRAFDTSNQFGASVSAMVTTPSAISHGYFINETNTGHTAYFDTSLGRNVTDADLTVHNTLVDLSSLVASGGTLKRHWFKAGLNIDTPNVTLLACKFDAQVTVLSNFVTLWYCTVVIASGDYGIGYGNYTAFRCKIMGGSDGVKCGAYGPTRLTECYVRTKGQSSADHNDGMQDSGGDAQVIIERNNIDANPVNGLGGANAALFGADACTGPHTWTDNFLAGGGYVMRLYENAHYNVQGNHVLNGSWSYAPAHTAVIPASYITWGTVRENLIVDSSDSTVSVLNQP